MEASKLGSPRQALWTALRGWGLTPGSSGGPDPSCLMATRPRGCGQTDGVCAGGARGREARGSGLVWAHTCAAGASRHLRAASVV